MSILPELKDRFRGALAGLTDDPAELLELIRRSQDPKFGDYQANLAMPLGKRLGRPPREVAAEVVGRLDVADLCQPPEIAGPGFINLRIKDEWLAERLSAAVADPRLGVAAGRRPRTFVIDFSAPNVAKPMHVGHIRSTVIGDALCRVLRFLGHTVISDNHIGDWGTQFGMILYGCKHFRDEEAYRRNPVEELARLYRLVRRLMDFKRQSNRRPMPKWPSADHFPLSIRTSTRPCWPKPPSCTPATPRTAGCGSEFLPFCEDEIERMYQRLDVTFDHTLGESFYEDRLAAAGRGVARRGIARESDGAICIFLEGQKTPMIVRKKDGAFLYATTDLATIRYRMETWRPGRDSLRGRSSPVAALPAAFRRRPAAGLQGRGIAARQFRHGAGRRRPAVQDPLGRHGGPGGAAGRGRAPGAGDRRRQRRRQARRAGAFRRAAPRRSPRRVGIAALKYADLSQNRTSDYVFSYDKMLAMNGNTATYMQYAYARVRSIFAKGNVDVDALRASGAPILLDSPAERALALELLRFSEALDLAVADYRPNQLTAYLFDLANRYSTFFEQCPVLRAESEPLRQSRLLLCDLTARTIQKGLELLGIRVVEKM